MKTDAKRAVAKFLFVLFFLWLVAQVFLATAPAWAKLTISITVVLSVVIFCILVLLMMLGYVRKAWMVRPDERGNYPIMLSLFGSKAINLNLTGADLDPAAWSLWQQTNNAGGKVLPAPPMPVQYQLEEQARHFYALTDGQSEVIDSVAVDL